MSFIPLTKEISVRLAITSLLIGAALTCWAQELRLAPARNRSPVDEARVKSQAVNVVVKFLKERRGATWHIALPVPGKARVTRGQIATSSIHYFYQVAWEGAGATVWETNQGLVISGLSLSGPLPPPKPTGAPRLGSVAAAKAWATKWAGNLPSLTNVALMNAEPGTGTDTPKRMFGTYRTSFEMRGPGGHPVVGNNLSFVYRAADGHLLGFYGRFGYTLIKPKSTLSVEQIRRLAVKVRGMGSGELRIRMSYEPDWNSPLDVRLRATVTSKTQGVTLDGETGKVIRTWVIKG
jgi:hypothetical protein